MDKHKNSKNRNHAASLDGVISDGRQLGVPVHRSYQPNRERQTPVLGGLNPKGDGFYPIRQSAYTLGQNPQASEADAMVSDAPIVLDDIPAEKKKKRRFRHRTKSSGRRLTAKRVALVILAAIVILAAYFAIKFYITQRNLLGGGGLAPAICDGEVPVSQLNTEGDSRVNILLLGIGSEGLLTDTIMIASLDPVNDKVDLLSVPRDLWVSIPGNGQEKLNAAYEYGQISVNSKNRKTRNKAGIELVDKTLENIVGVPIHYHAVFDFAAFKQIVNALGGISVNVPERLYDPTIAWENNYNPIIAEQGTQKFDGAKALLYAKSRQTSSDFERSERQRPLLVAMKEKTLSVGTFSNPAKVSSLMDSLSRNVYTDFDSRSIKCLYTQMSEVPSSNIKSLDLVTPPNDLLISGNIAGKSTLIPKAGMFEYSDIHKFVRTAFRDSFLARENLPVLIYNATDNQGLAKAKAEELKMYGYRVTVVENTKTVNPASSVVVDLSKGNGKYTRHYLERRFGINARMSLPGEYGITAPQDPSFVIILGKDAADSN